MYRKDKSALNHQHGFNMAERSPVRHSQMKKAASIRELNEAEIRGVLNVAYEGVHDESDGSEKDLEDGTFMVRNPEFTKKNDMGYMKEIEAAPWFHGSTTRTKAEEILSSSKDEGMFIVRAGVDEGEFYISAKGSEDGPKFRHIPVNHLDDKFVAICGPRSAAMAFDTFRDLLIYLKFHPTHFDDVGPDLTLKDYLEKK